MQGALDGCILTKTGFIKCSLRFALKQVPPLPDGCVWAEANLGPLKSFLLQAACEKKFGPDPDMPWNVELPVAGRSREEISPRP